MTDVADSFGLAILPEVHDGHATHERLSAHGFWTYDFVLPGLLLHAFETGNAKLLAEHLAASPDRQFTNLDCHDGIPVRPDLDGILTPVEMADLAERVRSTGGNVNRILSDAHAEAGDVHQLNCTYYSALGEDDERYLAARAIQLFARGVPQIYYVGLLAGANDHAAVDANGRGPRDQPPRLHLGRDRSGTCSAGRQTRRRPRPSSKHAPGLRRRSRCRG